jgi:hypothetical protein
MADMKKDQAELFLATVTEIERHAKLWIEEALHKAKRDAAEIEGARVALDKYDNGAAFLIPTSKTPVCLVKEFVAAKNVDGHSSIENVGFEVGGGHHINFVESSFHSTAGRFVIPPGRYRAFFALLPIEEPKL